MKYNGISKHSTKNDVFLIAMYNNTIYKLCYSNYLKNFSLQTTENIRYFILQTSFISFKK